MNVITLDCERWALSHADEFRPVKGLSLYELVKGIAERYRFVSVPTTIPPPDSGLVFAEGALHRDDRIIQIKKLQVFPDGVNLAVASSSDDADVVWKDLREWAVSIGGRPDPKFAMEYHVSIIVCDFDHSIDVIINGSSQIMNLISSKLDVSATVHTNMISFNADRTLLSGMAHVNPSLFKIERRAEVEYSKNRYFSMANMTTSNHISVLEFIEKIAAKHT